MQLDTNTWRTTDIKLPRPNAKKQNQVQPTRIDQSPLHTSPLLLAHFLPKLVNRSPIQASFCLLRSGDQIPPRELRLMFVHLVEGIGIGRGRGSQVDYLLLPQYVLEERIRIRVLVPITDEEPFRPMGMSIQQLRGGDERIDFVNRE